MFGSRAKWTTKDASDLDLAIDAGRPLTRAESNNLADAFEESDLPYKVDVVDMYTVSDTFRPYIEKERVELEWVKSGWEETTLGEFSPFLYGKSLPENIRREGNIPVVSSSGVTGRHDTALVQTKGIVIGRKGTVGKITRIQEPFWPIDTAFYIADEPKKKDLNFTYYLIQTLGLQHMNSDSAVPGLNRNNAHACTIHVPPLPKQKTIAEILGALDDKIDLNQRMCKTLESMAQALFKSWFVDFDPVHAKMRGEQPYGMDAETGAFFPDKLVESELGLIPEGWVVDELGNYVNFLYGKPLKEENRVTGPYPVYGSNGIIGYHHEFLVNDSGIIIGRKGNPGVVKLSTQGFYAIDTTFYVETTERLPSIFFWYHSLLQLELPRLSSDSAVPGLNRKSAYKCRVIIPCKQAVLQFHEFAGTIYEKIRSYESETKILVELRDYLLPKLVLGEVKLANKRI